MFVSWGSALKRVREEVDEVSKLRKLEQVDCGNCLRNLRRTKEDYEERYIRFPLSVSAKPSRLRLSMGFF